MATEIDPTFERIVTGEVAAVAARGLSMPSDAAVGGILRRTSVLFREHVLEESTVRELIPLIKKQAGDAIQERYNLFWQRVRDRLRDDPASRFRNAQELLVECGLSRMDYAAVAAHLGLLWVSRRSQDVIAEVEAYLLDELDSMLLSWDAADERMYLIIAGSKAVDAQEAARLARSEIRDEIALPQLLIGQPVRIQCETMSYEGEVYGLKTWVALIRPLHQFGWCMCDAYVREYVDGIPVVHTDAISEMVPSAFWQEE